MLPCRYALRRTPAAYRSLRSNSAISRQWCRYSSSSDSSEPDRPGGGFVRNLLGGLAVAGIVGGAIAVYPVLTEEKPEPEKLVLEDAGSGI